MPSVKIAAGRLRQYLTDNEHEKGLSKSLAGLAKIVTAKNTNTVTHVSEEIAPFLRCDVTVAEFRYHTYLFEGVEDVVADLVMKLPLGRPGPIPASVMVKSLTLRIATYLKAVEEHNRKWGHTQVDKNAWGPKDKVLEAEYPDVPAFRKSVIANRSANVHFQVPRASNDLQGYLVRDECTDDLVKAAWGRVITASVLGS